MARSKKGKAFYYRARAARSGVLRGMARRMAEVFTEGSTAGLVARLLDLENLSPEEIRTIRREVDRRLADE